MEASTIFVKPSPAPATNIPMMPSKSPAGKEYPGHSFAKSSCVTAPSGNKKTRPQFRSLTKNRGGRRPDRRSQASYGTSTVTMSNDISSLLRQIVRRTTHDIVAKDNARQVAETTSVTPRHGAADCASGRMRARWTCGAANRTTRSIGSREVGAWRSKIAGAWSSSIDGSVMSGGAHSV